MIFQNDKTYFQAIKTRSTKNRKIKIFPKGLTHGFAQKFAIFSSFFFLAIQARKMSFMTFQNEKMPFQAIKTRSSKRRKIDIFQKGLSNGFAQKLAIFPSFFCVQNEKTHFQAIKRRSTKSRKIDIFPKGLTQRFAQKLVIFPSFFF